VAKEEAVAAMDAVEVADGKSRKTFGTQAPELLAGKVRCHRRQVRFARAASEGAPGTEGPSVQELWTGTRSRTRPFIAMSCVYL
jgi:hypothetical protein